MENKTYLVEVIEDEASLRDALNRKLSGDGFSVIEAKNGKEGLDLALSKHPDLILLDIIMPVMDGITALHELRNDEWGANVPVIILTNLADKDKLMEEAPSFGPLDYILKADWKIEDVVKKVRERLEE